MGYVPVVPAKMNEPLNKAEKHKKRGTFAVPLFDSG